jgi:hypothetical protein
VTGGEATSDRAPVDGGAGAESEPVFSDRNRTCSNLGAAAISRNGLIAGLNPPYARRSTLQNILRGRDPLPPPWSVPPDRQPTIRLPSLVVGVGRAEVQISGQGSRSRVYARSKFKRRRQQETCCITLAA